MGIAFGDATKCIEELTKICLEHANEVYMGGGLSEPTFISLSDLWSLQEEMLEENDIYAVWVKEYYTSMYDICFPAISISQIINLQKSLLAAVVEMVGCTVDCGSNIIHIDSARKIFEKWNVIDAFKTELLEVYLKRYYKLSFMT